MKDNLKDFFLHNAFKICFAVLIVCLFFYILIPFILPVVMGGIFAMALVPFVDYLIRRGLSRDTSLVIMSLGLGAAVLTPGVAFFLRGSRIVNALMQRNDMNSLVARMSNSAYKVIDRFCDLYGFDNDMAKAKFDTLINSFGVAIARIFSDFMVSLPEILMGILITMLATYCFLKESNRIRSLFDRYFYFTKENGDNFIHMIKLGCQEVFITNIATGVIQASVVAVGGLIFQVGDFYLIFFITFIVSFIPILGAAPVAACMAIACFIDGRSGAGIGMLVFAAVAGISDNIIRPYLASLGNVSVHPFIGLLAVIGGVIMLGLPGLFIGPLLASLSFGALPIIIDEYYPTVREPLPDTIPE